MANLFAGLVIPVITIIVTLSMVWGSITPLQLKVFKKNVLGRQSMHWLVTGWTMT